MNERCPQCKRLTLKIKIIGKGKKQKYCSKCGYEFVLDMSERAMYV